MKIILASGSPRRKQLLEMLGLSFTVLPAQGEEHPPEHAEPDRLVMALASAKAREVAASADGDDLIIAADTIVWFDGRPFGKPRSPEHAAQMLRTLSGQTHEVYTGVCVLRGGRELCEAERSAVRFRPVSEEEIRRYVDSGEPMDKAGAYAAQGRGAVFVRGIEGDFFNVMGLPLCRLDAMLKQQGVEIL